MSRLQRLVIVSIVGVSAWSLASLWCVNPSECFYLSIPPVALAIYLTGIPDLRQTLFIRIRSALTIAAGLFVLSLGLAYLFLGPHLVLSWRFWLEAGTCLYFLTAVVIVLLAVRRSLLAFASTLHEHWHFSPGVRLIVCEVVPFALFVVFAIPYSLAFANVHRFKIPNWTDPKSALDRDYEEVGFTSADGTVLRGWWIPAKTPSDRTLVLCHGVAGNRTIVMPFTEVGDWLDANVLMFDLRGHGDSAGRTVTLGCREKDDVLAAIEYVRLHRPEQARQVIGMGTSLGAACLAEAAAEAEPPLNAVILDSCFTSTLEMTQGVLNPFPSSCHPWVMTLGLPMADWHAGCAMTAVRPEASIARLRAPVLFLHSHGDPLIPSEHSQRLYQLAAEPKQLCIFELPGHVDAFFAQRENYRAEVISFSA